MGKWGLSRCLLGGLCHFGKTGFRSLFHPNSDATPAPKLSQNAKCQKAKWKIIHEKIICVNFVFCVLLALFTALPSLGMVRQSNADYRARRVALSKRANGGVVILFAGLEGEGGNAINGFRQDNDFYYLSGWDQPGAALVISPATLATETSPAPALHRDPLPAATQSRPGKVDWPKAGRQRSASPVGHRFRSRRRLGQDARRVAEAVALERGDSYRRRRR